MTAAKPSRLPPNTTAEVALPVVSTQENPFFKLKNPGLREDRYDKAFALPWESASGTVLDEKVEDVEL